jgi:elongation factor Ts
VAEVSAQDVKGLRERTGAGMMDCKRALADAAGDVEKAVELLRERGLAKAGKRSGRATSEGAVGFALVDRAAGLVELGCETDFVAKTPDFQELLQAFARRVAEDPACASVAGLLDAKLDGERVADRIAREIARIGENIVLKRVARLEPGGPGVVGGYVHAGGKLGVVVALRSAAGAAAAPLAKDLAMHVAAADPTPIATDPSGIPAAVLEKERALYRRQAEQEGKPANVLDRIVEGRVRKFHAEVCLVEQPFVKDPDRTVKQLLAEAGEKVGHEIAVESFVRFKLGEADAG